MKFRWSARLGGHLGGDNHRNQRKVSNRGCCKVNSIAAFTGLSENHIDRKSEVLEIFRYSCAEF